MATGPNRRTFMTQTAALSGAGLWAVQLNTAGAPADARPRATSSSPPSAAPQDAVPLAPPDRQPPNLVLPEPVQRKVGWAIVGLGELALGEILPAFRQCRLSEPVALVSGHPDKAKTVAAAYGISPDSIYDYQS